MTIEDIALALTPGLGPKYIIRLLEVFESAERVFSASREEIIHFARLREPLADAVVSRAGFAAARREMEYCERNGITPIASCDEVYPKLLRETNDYPHILYVMGSVEALNRTNISIVGTRRISPYGDRQCFELVRDLGERLPTASIVSGLAFGVDSAAHRAALHCGVTTVAVVANPLPGVTPPQHTSLAREIIERGGAIISECHSQTKQKGALYISRNRIVAGMSELTIVVESPISGGSMVTAGIADGYGRQVMATPARVNDKNSMGCNLLIANRKALLCYSAEQIIREMMWDDLSVADRVAVAPIERDDLTPDQRGLMSCFRTNDPLSIDELSELSQLGISELSVLLMELELMGEIRMLPGSRYEPLTVISSR